MFYHGCFILFPISMIPSNEYIYDKNTHLDSKATRGLDILYHITGRTPDFQCIFGYHLKPGLSHSLHFFYFSAFFVWLIGTVKLTPVLVKPYFPRLCSITVRPHPPFIQLYKHVVNFGQVKKIVWLVSKGS